MSIYSDYAHGVLDEYEFRQACLWEEREEQWYLDHQYDDEEEEAEDDEEE